MDVSISKESIGIKAQMCRSKTGDTGKTTSKCNKRDVNGRSPVKTEKKNASIGSVLGTPFGKAGFC